MPYAKCKVYSDGGHYIAIPPTTRPKSPKCYRPEELIEVVANAPKEQLNTDNCTVKQPFVAQSDTSEEMPGNKIVAPKATRKITRKQLFNELYAESSKMKKRERKAFIVSKMTPYFNGEKEARQFVEDNFARQLRNLICRKTRLYRKARLQPWTYFCTFTYDSAKHTEESFRKKLSDTFKKMCYRRGWKYIGVWERSTEKERLHFHGLFYIPDGQMIGELVEVQDYSVKTEKVQKTVQNTYFNERFGRSDFEAIQSVYSLDNSIRYILKYIEKCGTKIVYSRNLPQYFVSDIMDEDVCSTIGQEDRKLLLFDSFTCWDEGCLVGKVSPEVIAQMPKAN
ncbi:MAG: hypothetical protein SOX04_07120 [Eubacteriales bacterium]|nr:hypothetical protein [Eubacteriales bacterium]